jgi:hypothetical protein
MARATGQYIEWGSLRNIIKRRRRQEEKYGTIRKRKWIAALVKSQNAKFAFLKEKNRRIEKSVHPICHLIRVR